MIAAHQSLRYSRPLKNLRSLLPLFSLLLVSFAAASRAASLTPGNLAVLRVGDGTATLTSVSTNLFLDEYTTNGVFVQTIAVPSSGPNALVASGSATSEGALSRSADGRALCFAGYNTNAGVASISGTTSQAAPRGVATIDAAGNYSLVAVTTNQFSANNVRSATTDGAGNFWGAGGTSGTYYLGTNSTAATVQSTVANTRVLNVINGNLYFTTGSGAQGLYGFTGIPTAAATASQIISAPSSPYGFAINPAGNIAYLADDALGIKRFTNSGSGWTVVYTNGPASRGLVVNWTDSAPVLYATTTTNSIISLVDTGFGSAVTLLVKGTNNTAFRGLAAAPEPLPSAPSITAGPQNQTNACSSGNATFSVTASGSALNYQWYFNSNALNGAVSSSLSVAAINGNVGNYFVVVSNSLGSVTSAVVTLTLIDTTAPVITVPANITTVRTSAGGAAVNFSVTANDSCIGSVAVNSTPASGSTFPVGTTTVTSIASDGSNSATNSFTVTVQPGFSYQDTDLLLVFRKPGFNDLLFNLGSVSNYLGQPNGSSVNVTNFNMPRIAAVFGGDLTGVRYALLAVTTADDAVLRAWLSDAAPGTPTDQTFSKWASQRSKINAAGTRATGYFFPDATNQSLSLSPSSADSYTFIAGNGGANDPATLSGAAPFPIEQDVAGAVRFFELKVSGSVPKPAAVQVGTFSVNGNGAVTFIGGIILPSITVQPVSLTNAVGTTATFTVTATGDEVLNYQWYFNNGAVLDATAPSFSISPVSAGNAGSYYVVVSNGGGSVTSSVVTLTVPASLGITTPPASLAVCERYPATFTVVATGSAPLAYQWRFNGGNIGGATSSSYSIASASTNNTGNYDVVVSNGGGSITSAVATLTVQVTFAGFANKGLVGVGRLSANSFDLLGPGVDTLGGIFSSMHFDQASLVQNGGSYSGTLYGLPDRGFGDGAQDYHLRVQTLSLSITPYYGSAPTSQTQIAFAPVATTLFNYDGTNFTGFDPDDLSVTNFPQSSPGSLGQGKRSLDAEGLVRTADGGYFVADEYGPMIVRFDASGALQYTLFPPEGLLPRRGPYPGANVFTGTNNPNSGRRSNRGFEGLTLMPDGKRLATVLQSPAIQDGGANNPSRNTRLLIFDIDSASPTFGRAIAEYIYQLTLNGSTATNRHTPLSELLAINNDQFLVLERDGIGLGATPPAQPIYKRVNVLSTRGATNIINTGYDLEVGAPGALSLPQGALPAGLNAAQRLDLVDIIDTNQLVKFGLNISTNQDQNTIGEKWEGLALIPLNDPGFPNDYLLLVGNDNDFKATNVIHNGVSVGTNAVTLDNMLLAYRVTIGTGCGTTNPPINVPPSIAFITPTNATLSGPATVTLTASAYDQDGLVTNVNFFLNGGLIGNDTTFPFQFTLNGVAPGSYDFTAVAFDQSGAAATSAVKTVVVTVANISPTVAITSPTNGATVRANAGLSVLVAAGDADGSVTNVQLYEGASLIAASASAPFTTIAPNIAPGVHSYTVIAYDNQGAAATSSVVTVTALIGPAITVQPVGGSITAGGDFTFSVTATGDAPLSYQWRFGAANISGATSDSYSISNATTTASGNYQVVVSNPAGSVTSAVAVLTVKAGFTYKDTDLLLVFRKPGFNDLLFNLGSVSNYLGRANGALLNVTNYDLARVLANFSGDLTGVKYALLGVTTADDTVPRAWLSDAAPGAVTDETFSKWASQRSKINAVGVRASVYGYPAATNQSLSLPPSNPDSYTFVAGNGGANDPATLSGAAPFPIEQDFGSGVRFFELRVSTLVPKPAATQVGHFHVDVNGNVTFTGGFIPPSITGQPVNASAACGGMASFSVNAAGDEPLSYQWYFGASAIGGAVGSTLNISPATAANAGTYSVVVSNSGGSVTSSIVTLVITDNLAPVLSLPANIVVTRTSPAGATVNFTVAATDNCAASPSVISTPASGSTFPVGITTVVNVASDGNGNSATNSFTVTVQPGFTYRDTDLLLVFRKGGFNDLLFNLGSVSNYLGQPNGATLAVTNFNLARLSANFGGNLAGVKYALLGVTTADDSPLRAWLSDAAPGAVTDETFSKWASQRSKINAIGSRATGYSFPEATNQSLSLPPSNSDSYTFIASNGGANDPATLSGAAPFPIEQDVTNFVRFFELKVSTENPKPAAVQVGSFTVALNGTVNFIAGQSAPVAGPDAIQRYAGSSVKVPIGELLLNDTDADSDPITLVSVGGTTNATVTIEGQWVVYTPKAGFTNSDTFTYSISDGRGGFGVGVVTVSITTDTLPTFNNTITAQGGGSFLIAFSGIPGRTYTIQYTDTLAPANWQFLGTATANAIGYFQIIDTPPGATRFYRTVYP